MPMNPLEKKQLLPDIAVTDVAGQIHQLWNFRQRTHLTLIYDPSAAPDARSALSRAVLSRQKMWDWLKVKVLVLSEMPAEFPAGVYLIDRYGYLVAYLADLSNPWAEIEKEYIYMEAGQC
jgi:hypothetical protein